MDGEIKKQYAPEAGDLVVFRLRLLGITQTRIARDLDRTSAAISQAINQPNSFPTLFARIERRVARYERDRTTKKLVRHTLQDTGAT